MTMTPELRKGLNRTHMKMKVGRGCTGVERGVILSPVKEPTFLPWMRMGFEKKLVYQVWGNRVENWKRQVKLKCQPLQCVTLAILLPNRLRPRQQRNLRAAVGVGLRTSDHFLWVQNMYPRGILHLPNHNNIHSV